MLSTGAEWTHFLLPFFWGSCGAPCPLSSMSQGWLCLYLSSCVVGVAVGWHITAGCDMVGVCERSVEHVICKGTAGVMACPGRGVEYFYGNLLEAIDAAPVQNSSIARKHASNQYVLVLIRTGKASQRQKTTRLVNLMSFCNLWLKKTLCRPCSFCSPFQASMCQCLM